MDRDLILAKLQEDNTLSNTKLAKLFNVSPSKMKKALQEFNIELMPNSERLSLRNKLLCTQPSIEITERANQIIMGSLLGDGCVVRKKTNCIFFIRHSLVQKPYLLYKYSLLIGENLDVKYFERDNSYKLGNINGRLIKDNGYCEIRSKVNQAFNKYRDEWYTPTKEIPDSIYNLDALGLSIWYMDDGTKHFPTGAYFSTHCFNHNSQLKLQDMLLKNFNLHVNIHKNKDKEILYLRHKDYPLFVDIVKEYICPEMNYKIIGHNKQGELLET